MRGSNMEGPGVAVTVIESSADLDGLHCWPGAHEARSYLRAPTGTASWCPLVSSSRTTRA